MRAEAVPFSEVAVEGRRLTGGFHLSEDQGAIRTLRTTGLPSNRVGELVMGQGVFRGQIFSRIYADGPEYGEPYVSAKDLVMADVRPSAFLSRRHGGLLDELRLRKGMIVVTCSGMNLGKAIWVRSSMGGLVGSHDLIRVCPNAESVPPGYLFAFLASRYGRASIRKRIYGGNIKHVEPHHISELRVPRLSEDLEDSVHRSIVSAEEARTQSARFFADAHSNVRHILCRKETPGNRNWNIVSSSLLQIRLDAYYFSDECLSARRSFDSYKGEVGCLSRYAEILIPKIFKRVYTVDPQLGYPYLTGREVFHLVPLSEKHLLRRVAEENQLIVRRGSVLIQEAGQLGGLIGRSIFVGEWLEGSAVSNNMMRVTAKKPEDSGYIYAVLSTYEGEILIAREAAGSSIPHIDAKRIRSLRVPWPPAKTRRAISELVHKAVSLRDKACKLESDACRIVEHAIEQAS